MLYIVATPIGNLGDMTHRAVEVLENADIIAAEDTRQSMKLLNHFGISKTRMVSCHKFNEASVTAWLITEMQAGRDVAVITDAGTPCISDPGTLLVEQARAAGIQITAVPGACAAIAALSVSGFHAASFAFYGFLPRAIPEIVQVCHDIQKSSIPVSIFYESPMRIVKSIEVLEKELPEARLCLCNDLTKRFERHYTGSPADVLVKLNENSKSAYGEYVLVLEHALNSEQLSEEHTLSPEAWVLDRMLYRKCSMREAIESLTVDGSSGYSKNQLKRAGITLKSLLSCDVTE